MEKTVESLAGYVEHIIYRNADNGYTVLNLVSGEDEITCVGIFSAIAEGENIEAQGEYTEHPTYGQQFKVTSFEEKAPEEKCTVFRPCISAHGITLHFFPSVDRRKQGQKNVAFSV